MIQRKVKKKIYSSYLIKLKIKQMKKKNQIYSMIKIKREKKKL